MQIKAPFDMNEPPQNSVMALRHHSEVLWLIRKHDRLAGTCIFGTWAFGNMVAFIFVYCIGWANKIWFGSWWIHRFETITRIQVSMIIKVVNARGQSGGVSQSRKPERTKTLRGRGQNEIYFVHATAACRLSRSFAAAPRSGQFRRCDAHSLKFSRAIWPAFRVI